MRAREFIAEQRGRLDPGQSEPLQHTYFLPGVRNNDAYHAMRVGVAVARARAILGGVDQEGMPDWNSETAFGENAVVSGFNDGVEEVLDLALAMTHTPGGKVLVGSKTSTEPKGVGTQSPMRPFAGYPR